MISTVLIAFGVSADAFAVAAGKGAGLRGPVGGHVLRAGLVFGAMEMAALLAGWMTGQAASPVLAAVDHWIAFALLGGIGSKMVWECLAGSDATSAGPVRGRSLPGLVLTALGTSIDTFAVGTALAFVEQDVILTASIIGVVSCLMAWVGYLVGRYVGTALGRAAELGGGLVLIGIGVSILVQHLIG